MEPTRLTGAFGEIAIWVALTVGFSPGPAAADGVRFIDRSLTANLSRTTWSGGPDKRHILSTTGNGVLALDYDGDGYQDLFLVSAFRLPRGSRLLLETVAFRCKVLQEISNWWPPATHNRDTWSPNSADSRAKRLRLNNL